MSINLENCLNLRVKIQTTINTTFQGTIYSYNPSSNLITLILDDNSKSVILDKARVENDAKGSTIGANNNSKNYKILKTTFIKNITIISRKPALKAINNSNLQPLEIVNNVKDIKQISGKDINKSYERLERQYKEDFELNKILQRQVLIKNHLGIEIFKKLYKILPKNEVKFLSNNNDILVFDSIIIKYPYLEVKYKDSRKDDDGLEHIKKIVSEAKAKGG